MKLLVPALLILLLSISVFAAISEGIATSAKVPIRLGVSRVSNYEPRLHLSTLNQFVALQPTYSVPTLGVGRGGASNYHPRGSARVRSVASYGYPSAQVTLKTKDLPSSADVRGQFEVWLIDSETGYRLSLGTFTTQQGGVADFRYVADTYLNAYDGIEVTFEPLDDVDITPGPLILYGFIKPPE
ncbi:MAG TPA: anti-sigma factor [Candidatus Nanoarchaeia archaeon]|nr:anti-sigma factor [Candidatus Nanoarchaeia archaeon]